MQPHQTATNFRKIKTRHNTKTFVLHNIQRQSDICAQQACSGAGTRRSTVPANIFEPERRSGKHCLSQPECSYCSVPANQPVLSAGYLMQKIWSIGSQENHWNSCH